MTKLFKDFELITKPELLVDGQLECSPNGQCAPDDAGDCYPMNAGCNPYSGKNNEAEISDEKDVSRPGLNK